MYLLIIYKTLLNALYGVCVDFWNTYQKARQKEGFGKEQVTISARQRIHLSLNSVEGKYKYVEPSSAAILDYAKEGEEGTRYIVAKQLSYDLLVSLYDVNASSMLAMRISKPEDKKTALDIAGSFVKKLKKPNLELRFIGMQNQTKGYDSSLVEIAEAIYNLKPTPILVEVDLFGTLVRNIVLDAKLGMSFDLWLFNRAYKPGELQNTTSIDVFNASASNLKPIKV